MSWASKYSKPYLVDKGEKVHLKDYDPADTAKLRSRERAVELLQKGVARMAELQDMLYAQDRWGVLLTTFVVVEGDTLNQAPRSRGLRSPMAHSLCALSSAWSQSIQDAKKNSGKPDFSQNATLLTKVTILDPFAAETRGLLPVVRVP